MANEQSRYNGDDYHPILHTGNLVEGDQIAFDHPVYERGSQGPPVFRGFYRVSGRVSHIRLGAKAHQDKITITPDNGGAQISINAKTLKDVAIYRTPWPDQSLRQAALTQQKALRNEYAQQNQTRDRKPVSIER
jgi:hypothetical protein